MPVEIKSRRDGSVIYTVEGETLMGANLSGLNLIGADLAKANLLFANLGGANLREANLSGANLRLANLSSANLDGADLLDANLNGANLTNTNLTDANLRPIRDDFWSVLCSLPQEIPALRAALVAGKVDGSTYTGECACLVGTLANAHQCKYLEIPGLAPNASRPAERFFLSIGPGDTPDKNPCAQIAIEWIDTFTANMRAAFGRSEP